MAVGRASLAAPIPPVPAVAAPRATITSFLSGISPLTGTGTSGTTLPTSVVPQAPATDTRTGEAPEALASATPNALAKGPEDPSAAPELPPTTNSTSGETMLPGESNEWQANDGVTLFTKPPEKDKIIYGSEIPEFGDGSHRQRYPLEFKLKAIENACQHGRSSFSAVQGL